MRHGKYYYIGLITLGLLFVAALTLVPVGLRLVLFAILGFTVFAVAFIGFEFVATSGKYAITDHRTWLFTIPFAAAELIVRFVFGINIFLPVYLAAVFTASAVLAYERFSVSGKKRSVLAPIIVGTYSSLLMASLWIFTAVL